MTQPVPVNAVSLSAATAVLLTGSAAWITLTPGTLSAVIEPTFLDSQTGQQIAPGDVWFQWQDTSVPPVTYACPLRSIGAVQLAAPVT
jgi:hypothetical protein